MKKEENIDRNMTSIKELLDMTRIPRHVAIIMDGNGRWAKSHGKERVFGHQEGVDSVDKVTEAAAELGYGSKEYELIEV